MGGRRRGFILIIVIGLLGAMAAFAIMLSQSASSTQQLADDFHHSTVARLGARSGLEKYLAVAGTAGFHEAPGSESDDAFYFGEDANANGELDSGEDVDGDGLLDIRSCELSRAQRPSLPVMAGPSPAQVTIRDRTVGYSGSFTDMAGRLHSVYQLKVTRPDSGIDLNGGLEAGALDANPICDGDLILTYTANDFSHPFNQPTTYLLAAYADVIRHEFLVPDDRSYDWSLPFDDPYNMPSGENYVAFNPMAAKNTLTDLGETLIQNRPASGWKREDEPQIRSMIRTFIQNDISGAVWNNHGEALVDLIMADLAFDPARDHQFVRVFKYDDDYYENGDPNRNSRRYRMSNMPSSRVNLNGASRRVLAALVNSVKGVFKTHDKNSYRYSWSDESSHPWSYDNRWRCMPNLPAKRYQLMSVTESRKMADEIVDRRRANPFSGSVDFRSFLGSFAYGWDHRHGGAFHDQNDGNVREKLLFEVLDAGITPRSLMWPNAFGVDVVRKGGNTWFGHDLHLFDELTSRYLLGAEVSYGEAGRSTVESRCVVLTPTGQVAAERVLEAQVDPLRVLSLDSQKDFADAIGSSHTFDFATGPEIPPNAPVDWSGQVFLRAKSPPGTLLNVMGGGLVSHHSFDPYSHSNDPTGQRVSGKPEWIRPGDSPLYPSIQGPSWASDSVHVGDYVTDLRPKAGAQSRPLIDVGDPDQHTHLVPGGGIRMAQQDNHFSAAVNDEYMAHRMVLRGDNQLFNDPSDGMVSLLIKPNRHHFNNSGGVAALFCYDFLVRDPGDPTATYHGQIVCLKGRPSGPVVEFEVNHFPKTDPTFASSLLFPQMQGTVGNIFDNKDRQRIWCEVRFTPCDVATESEGNFIFTMPLGLHVSAVDREFHGIDPPYTANQRFSASKVFCLELPDELKDVNDDSRNSLDMGRWHHIVVAWKDLENLLDINGPTHGGCVAVYHNGVLKGEMGSYAVEGQFWSTHFNQWEPEADWNYWTTPSVSEFEDYPPPGGPPNDAWGHIQAHLAANLPAVQAAAQSWWTAQNAIFGGSLVVFPPPPTNYMVTLGTGNFAVPLTGPGDPNLPATWNNSFTIYITPYVDLYMPPHPPGTFLSRLWSHSGIAVPAYNPPPPPAGGGMDPDSAETLFGTTFVGLKRDTTPGAPSLSGSGFFDYATHGRYFAAKAGINDAQRLAYLRGRNNKFHVGYVPRLITDNNGNPTKLWPGHDYFCDDTFMGLAICESPGGAIDDAKGFRPEIQGYNYSPYGNRVVAPATLILNPLAAANVDLIELKGVRWRLHMPDFNDADHQQPTQSADPKQAGWEFIQQYMAANQPALDAMLNAYLGSNFAPAALTNPPGFVRQPGSEIGIFVNKGGDYQAMSKDDMPADGWDAGELQLRPVVRYEHANGDVLFKIPDPWHPSQSPYSHDVPEFDPAVSAGGQIATDRDQLWAELTSPEIPDLKLRRSQWAADPEATADVWWGSDSVSVGSSATLEFKVGVGSDRTRLYVTPVLDRIDLFYRLRGGAEISSLIWK